MSKEKQNHFLLKHKKKKNVSVIGRCSIPLPRITVPDAEAEKKDDMPKKVAPAMFYGHSKPSSVGGILLGVSLDNERSKVDVQFQFPKVYEQYFQLIRYLTTIVRLQVQQSA